MRYQILKLFKYVVGTKFYYSKNPPKTNIIKKLKKWKRDTTTEIGTKIEAHKREKKWWDRKQNKLTGYGAGFVRVWSW